MGRIDEALRRAGATRREAELPKTGAPGPFVSAWTVGESDFNVERPVPVAVRPSAPIRVAATPRADDRLPAERFTAAWRERLAIGEGNRVLMDQYRRLAATLIHVQRTDRLRIVMVTSALPEDGKTLTAVNLSLVLSESYRRRVLLVEGDFRRPAISRAAGIQPGPGLSEALKANDERKAALVPLTATLTLLPAGRPDSDPLSALTSARLQALLQDASERFDWVIIDTPPLEPTADASLLCPLVDTALLVVRAGRTPLDTVKKAVETLGRDRIFGVVLNGSEEAAAAHYDYSPIAAPSVESSVGLSPRLETF